MARKKKQADPVWNCSGIDPTTGKKRTIQMEAPNADVAVIKVRSISGLLAIEASKSGTWDQVKTALMKLGGKSVSRKSVQELIRSLATTAETLNPLESFILARDNMRRGNDLRGVLDEIIDDIQTGTSLEVAVEKQSKWLGESTVSVYLAGVSTGRLSSLLNALADNMDVGRKARSSFRNGLIEPAILMLFVLGVVYFQGLSVFPKIANFLSDEVGGEVPPLMRWTIALSNGINNNWLFIILGCLAFYGFATWMLRIETVKLWVGETKCRVPLVGIIGHHMDIGSFCSTMGITLSAGLPINECLELSSTSVKNMWVRKAILSISSRIATGEAPQQAFVGYEKQLTRAPAMLMHQTSTGLPDPGKPWQLYSTGINDGVENKVKAMISTLNPIMMVVIGILILGIGMASMQGMNNVFTGIADT